MSETPCVLTSRDGQLVQPSSAYLIGKAERELVELQDLPPLLQTLSLVAPGLERWRERLKPLGIQNFSTETLLRAINDKPWLERRNVEWFAKLFSRLQTTGVSAASLAHIPLLRCSDGVCRPPSHGTIYFRSGSNAAEISLPTPGPEIHFLDSAVAAMLTGNLALSQWAHSAIGVREFSLREYIVSSLCRGSPSRPIIVPLWLLELNSSWQIYRLWMKPGCKQSAKVCLGSWTMDRLSNEVKWEAANL